MTRPLWPTDATTTELEVSPEPPAYVPTTVEMLDAIRILTCEECAADSLTREYGPDEDVRLYIYPDGHATLVWQNSPDPGPWDGKSCDGRPMCRY